MSKEFDLLKESFDAVIYDLENNGGKNLKTTTMSMTITPIRRFDGENIKSIRRKNNLTQSILAKYLGVSKKTVEAWESNKNKPNGPSSRLIEMIEDKKISIVQ